MSWLYLSMTTFTGRFSVVAEWRSTGTSAIKVLMLLASVWTAAG